LTLWPLWIVALRESRDQSSKAEIPRKSLGFSIGWAKPINATIYRGGARIQELLSGWQVLLKWQDISVVGSSFKSRSPPPANIIFQMKISRRPKREIELVADREREGEPICTMA
jgi:hypothetical protein